MTLTTDPKANFIEKARADLKAAMDGCPPDELPLRLMFLTGRCSVMSALASNELVDLTTRSSMALVLPLELEAIEAVKAKMRALTDDEEVS